MAVKPKVLNSYENPDSNCCVNIFVREDGTFGFAEYRNDPEDGGRWFTLRDFSGQVFDTQENALEAAKESILWLPRADK